MKLYEPSALLTQKEVMRRIGVRSRETVARWVRNGAFPSPIVVGGGRLRWLSTEVEAWVLQRAEARTFGHGVAPIPPRTAGSAIPTKPKDILTEDLLSWAAANGGKL